MGCLNRAGSRISYFTPRYRLRRSKGAGTKTRAGQTAKKTPKKRQNVDFGLQSREVCRHNTGAAAMQTEQNATRTEAPAHSLFSRDMSRPRLL